MFSESMLSLLLVCLRCDNLSSVRWIVDFAVFVIFTIFVIWGVMLNPGQSIILAQNAVGYLKISQKQSTKNKETKRTTRRATFTSSNRQSIFNVIVIPFRMSLISVSPTLTDRFQLQLVATNMMTAITY